MTTQSNSYDDLIDFIISGKSPEEIIAFRPSEESEARVHFLIVQEKNAKLSKNEKAELDHYLFLEHIIRLAKARARKVLRQ